MSTTESTVDSVTDYKIIIHTKPEQVPGKYFEPYMYHWWITKKLPYGGTRIKSEGHSSTLRNAWSDAYGAYLKLKGQELFHV